MDLEDVATSLDRLTNRIDDSIQAADSIEEIVTSAESCAASGAAALFALSDADRQRLAALLAGQAKREDAR